MPDHSPATVTPVDEADFVWDDQTGPAAAVRRIVTDATQADHTAPLDEAALLRLRHRGLAGSTLWLARGPEPAAGLAWCHDAEVELVVAPAVRRHGLGTGLADAVMARAPQRVTAWSHGHHPGAAALARRHGLEAVRELWVMRRPLSALPPLPESPPSGVTVRAFRPGLDDEAFLALNAEAFAHHPEQGDLDAAGLAERMAESWFDPAGFFLAERPASHTRNTSHTDGRELVGFHWTKVHDDKPGVGEVYVVGVSPRAQGGGLGRLLTLTGLHHLAGRGLTEVLLYVEGDNAPAVAVYSRLGFTHAAEDTHVQYAR